jgi:predicted nucleic acid-binding protein
MSGERVVADISALIHLLDGNVEATRVLQGSEVFVSFITELELLSGKRNPPGLLSRKRALLGDCTILDVNNRIKELVIHLRVRHGLKLPDCIIAATAIHLDLPLITSDSHFERLKDEVALYWIRGT